MSSNFEPILPIRVLDTRRTKPVDGGEPQTYELPSEIFPPDTVAVSMNVVAVGAELDGFVTVWPSGQAMPDTSIINFRGDQYAYNGAVICGVGPGLSYCAQVSQECHLIVDVTGYWETDVPGWSLLGDES